MILLRNGAEWRVRAGMGWMGRGRTVWQGMAGKDRLRTEMTVEAGEAATGPDGNGGRGEDGR